MEHVKEMALKGIVDGKPLKEWLNAPHGQFAKAVREKVDPYFGLGADEEPPPRTYSVKVRYSYTPEPQTEYASKTYEVEAVTPEQAKEIAEELWDDDGRLETGENHEITDIGEPTLLGSGT